MLNIYRNSCTKKEKAIFYVILISLLFFIISLLMPNVKAYESLENLGDKLGVNFYERYNQFTCPSTYYSTTYEAYLEVEKCYVIAWSEISGERQDSSGKVKVSVVDSSGNILTSYTEQVTTTAVCQNIGPYCGSASTYSLSILPPKKVFPKCELLEGNGIKVEECYLSAELIVKKPSLQDSKFYIDVREDKEDIGKYDIYAKLTSPIKANVKYEIYIDGVRRFTIGPRVIGPNENYWEHLIRYTFSSGTHEIKVRAEVYDGGDSVILEKSASVSVSKPKTCEGPPPSYSYYAEGYRCYFGCSWECIDGEWKSNCRAMDLGKKCSASVCTENGWDNSKCCDSYNKPSSFYAVDYVCYYGCNLDCLGGKWQITSCKEDRNRECEESVCTNSGWDNSICSQPLKLKIDVWANKDMLEVEQELIFRGKVTDEGENPVGNAKVMIYNPLTGGWYYTFTDSTGEFEYAINPDNSGIFTFNFKVEKEGYETAKTEYTVTVKPKELPKLNVELISPENNEVITSMPITFMVRVTSNGEPVEGAKVMLTFTDGGTSSSGWLTTDSNGYATYTGFSSLSSGSGVSWYAEAYKDGYESGMSEIWYFKYEKANTPPTIYKIYPSGSIINVLAGETVEFKVRVEDPDDNLDKVVWFVNGEKVATHSVSGSSDMDSWSYTFSGNESVIDALVYDQDGAYSLPVRWVSKTKSKLNLTLLLAISPTYQPIMIQNRDVSILLDGIEKIIIIAKLKDDYTNKSISGAKVEYAVIHPLKAFISSGIMAEHKNLKGIYVSSFDIPEDPGTYTIEVWAEYEGQEITAKTKIDITEGTPTAITFPQEPKQIHAIEEIIENKIHLKLEPWPSESAKLYTLIHDAILFAACILSKTHDCDDFIATELPPSMKSVEAVSWIYFKNERYLIWKPNTEWGADTPLFTKPPKVNDIDEISTGWVYLGLSKYADRVIHSLTIPKGVEVVDYGGASYVIDRTNGEKLLVWDYPIFMWRELGTKLIHDGALENGALKVKNPSFSLSPNCPNYIQGNDLCPDYRSGDKNIPCVCGKYTAPNEYRVTVKFVTPGEKIFKSRTILLFGPLIYNLKSEPEYDVVSAFIDPKNVFWAIAEDHDISGSIEVVKPSQLPQKSVEPYKSKSTPTYQPRETSQPEPEEKEEKEKQEQENPIQSIIEAISNILRDIFKFF